MSDVIARLRSEAVAEMTDYRDGAGCATTMTVDIMELLRLLDVCEAARARREAERGEGSGQPISAQRIMETQTALYVALDRLEATDARE